MPLVIERLLGDDFQVLRRHPLLIPHVPSQGDEKRIDKRLPSLRLLEARGVKGRLLVEKYSTSLAISSLPCSNVVAMSQVPPARHPDAALTSSSITVRHSSQSQQK